MMVFYLSSVFGIRRMKLTGHGMADGNLKIQNV